MHIKLSVLVLALLFSCAFAQTSPTFNFTFPDGGNGSISIPSFSCPAASDVKQLNFALQLEFLQTEFWKQALQRFQTGGNGTVGRLDDSCLDNVDTFNKINALSTQDNAHSTQLTDNINRLCNSMTGDDKAECLAAQPCSFNFSSVLDVNSTGNGTDQFNSILDVGVTLEDLGVQAYLGLLSTVDDNASVQLLLKMVTVEARQAAYVRYLAGVSPFPSNLDSSKSRTAVKCAVVKYIDNPDCCPGWENLKC